MRYFCTGIFLLFTLTLSAQYDRGRGYFSGNTTGSWRVTEYQLPMIPGIPDIGGPTKVRTTEFRSLRTGYFLLDRLLIGARLDYFRRVDPSSSSNDFGFLLLQPFARYYVTADPDRRVNFFGELGFGTVGIGDADGFETDFHLGTGAEIRLRPGILGTANLNYNANASGLNFTTLDLGLNVLTGQLAGTSLPAQLAAGTLTVNGNLGNLAYGRMQRGEAVDSDLAMRFTPSVGFFVARGVVLELGTDLVVRRQKDQIGRGPASFRELSFSGVDLNFDARYYPLARGRLLPYLTAGIEQRFQRRTFTEQGRSFNQDDTSGAWRAGGGLSYFFSPHLALDAAVRYEQGGEPTADSIFPGPITDFSRVAVAAGVRFFLPRS